MSNCIFTLGEPFFTFNLSEVGELCKLPVDSEEVCRHTGKGIVDAVYSNMKGEGHDLPLGCIWDAVTPGKIFTYWNAAGVAISLDPNIRQICYDVGRVF